MKLAWARAIRFVSSDGRTLYGDPILPYEDYDLGSLHEGDQIKARVIEGTDLFDESGATRLSSEVVTVSKLLGPLTPTQVPMLRCVGLNYAKHIKEAGRSPPPYPFYFMKPSTTIVGHHDPVIIPKIAQDSQADYEGELCLILGKDAKDVSIDDALSYVGAYTAGNDISSRKLQRDPAYAGRIPQWSFSKGFDTFAPLGPCLISSNIIPDPSKLHLRTVIDDEVRQNEAVSDLMFGCAYLISYFSTGTTLQKGSVIMTGTPGGVGAGLNPPRYLVPGTKMEVKISRIGTLRNTVEFA